MPTLLSKSVIPKDYDYKTPKHLIIWLDEHIGDSTKYISMKKSFSSNIDPRSQTWTMLTDRDYHNLLRTGDAMQVHFGGVLCLLLTFTDPNLCYKAFERYRDRRILFITSGSLGQHIVPSVTENFRQVFTDPANNRICNSIYIFCFDINLHCNWAMDYFDYIQMFDHEATLLTRMTRDMADYYFTQAEGQRANEDIENALRFYQWSKKLFLQYEKMEQPCRKYIKNIDTIIEEIEKSRQDCADEEGQCSESCS